MTALHKDADVVALAADALAGLRELCRSLVYATVLTDDGFEVAHAAAGAGGAVDDGRMASMASSIQALGDAVARELGIGESDYVVLASERGHVIQRRVAGRPLVLAALFDDDETLGKALSISRVATERLARALEALPAGPASLPADASR